MSKLKKNEEFQTVYVVTEPWDSYRVGDVMVFEDEQNAIDTAEQMNRRKGYDKGQGIVSVEECIVIKRIKPVR